MRVAIVVLLGLAGCLPVMPTRDANIHVFVFAGFRFHEVEWNIGNAVAVPAFHSQLPSANPLLNNAGVLRYKVSGRQHIIDLAELNYIGTANWHVPYVAYGYHIIVDAPPTDSVLDALAEWARDTTEFEGSVVSVVSDANVLQLILRISDGVPKAMNVVDLRSREP